jgi:hypothetical protein
LKNEKIWEIQKKGKLNSEIDMENIEERQVNCEKIWKIWKKGKSNTDKIPKIWKKG